MEKDKVNKEIDKLMKNKKFVNCLIVLLVIIFLYLATTSFLSYGGNKSNKSSSIPSGAQEVASDETTMSAKELATYEEQQKQELKEILAQMDGVGKVDVMMYFESGEVKVPAEENSTQVSQTNEEDNSGGTRTTTSQNEGSTIVMQSDGSSSEPFITKVYKPQITGVVIVAEGAQSNKIKYDIQQAVSSLYNLSLDKVNVYPMSS